MENFIHPTLLVTELEQETCPKMGRKLDKNWTFLGGGICSYGNQNETNFFMGFLGSLCKGVSIKESNVLLKSLLRFWGPTFG